MRLFPKPDRELLKKFVIHTNQIERLPMTMPILEEALKEGKEHGDPLAVGQFSAINKVLSMAAEDDLLPRAEDLRSRLDSHEHLIWLRDLHQLVMLPIAIQGEKTLDPMAPLRHEAGTYRVREKNLGTRRMPSPFKIEEHLHVWLKEVCEFERGIWQKLVLPTLLTSADISAIAEMAYRSNLKICCIKPFEDGSNRVGRLVENLLRCHWGLPWKIIPLSEKDVLLKDVQALQDAEYKN